MNFTHAQQFAQQGLYTGLDEARLKEAIPSGVLPRLGTSVEFLRQAHAELSVLADLICGPGSIQAAPHSPPPATPSLADAIEGAATELNIIAASVAECVMRIRNRLIG